MAVKPVCDICGKPFDDRNEGIDLSCIILGAQLVAYEDLCESCFEEKMQGLAELFPTSRLVKHLEEKVAKLEAEIIEQKRKAKELEKEEKELEKVIEEGLVPGPNIEDFGEDANVFASNDDDFDPYDPKNMMGY